jgi:hypothetical protein
MLIVVGSDYPHNRFTGQVRIRLVIKDRRSPHRVLMETRGLWLSGNGGNLGQSGSCWERESVTAENSAGAS